MHVSSHRLRSSAPAALTALPLRSTHRYLLQPLLLRSTDTFPGTTSLSSYFGYYIKSIMSWEGEVMITANHITDPYGTTKVPPLLSPLHCVAASALRAHDAYLEPSYCNGLQSLPPRTAVPP